MSAPTFRAIVERALVEALRKEENPKKLASALAEELRAQFRAEGFSVHARGACIRPWGATPDKIGRPMTEEEALSVGLELVAEGTPDAPIG